MKLIVEILLLVLVVSLAGCGTQMARDDMTATLTSAKLHKDLRTLQNLAPQLEELDREFTELHTTGNWQKQGYFDAPEAERLEGLLFRFSAARDALWQIANSYRAYGGQVAADEMMAEAELLYITAGLLITSHDAALVLEFAGDKVAITEINQAYPRSEIPFGTYDTLRVEVLGSERRKQLSEVEKQLKIEYADSGAVLWNVAGADPGYQELIADLPALIGQTNRRLAELDSVYTSDFVARTDALSGRLGQHKTLYKLRSVVFKDVSRLKSPTAHLIEFSAAQKAQVYALLEPGDLVFTYTAGYMSSIFIPGAFKHGITFIGSAEQRASRPLNPNIVAAFEQYYPERLGANLQQTELNNGKAADMIEAVAEGVIFNNLAYVMDTHINRLLVLRPQLSEAERDRFLLEVYSYLGEGYDFRFDFADPTYQVCTEVIYRAIDGKADISFALTERAGHPTLSADDIVNYYLNKARDKFEFVLYAEQDPARTDYQARVLTGAAGQQRLQELLAEVAQD